MEKEYKSTVRRDAIEEITTRYDSKKGVVISREPMIIPISKKDYEVLQKLFNNEFGKVYFSFPEIFEYNESKKIVKLGLVYRNSSIGKKIMKERVAELSGLENIAIYDSGLNRIPNSIGDLKLLKSLYLPGNEIKCLPDSICNLELLESLNLSHNCLTSLPENIGNLKSLKYLELSSNCLTSLPSSIVNLSSLDSLHLFGNQLTSLPEGISELPCFKSLPRYFMTEGKVSLVKNPFKSFPVSLLEKMNVDNINELLYRAPNLDEPLKSYLHSLVQTEKLSKECGLKL